MEIDLNSGNLYRVYARIDLDAIRENITAMKKNMHLDSQIMAVVKSDGYGHGAAPVARAVEDLVSGFAVATVEEALSLREHGIKKMILILGHVHESLYEEVILHNISMSVYTYKAASLLSQKASELMRNAKIHIKLDTGMSRLGARDNEETLHMLEEIQNLPNLITEGIFTHFSSADELDKSKSVRQLNRFLRFLKKVKEKGIQIPICHCSNSAGIIDMPEANFHMVRAGIALYGLYPSNEVQREHVSLAPALELKSHIVYLKEVEPGVGVSYGSIFITSRFTKIATIPVGYGDGYPRALSNVGSVLIRGQRAPILGRICMDQFMVDVTDIPDVKEGDIVTLIGKDGEECISVEELARLAENTFNYEIVCNLGNRIPRVYCMENKIMEYRSYLSRLS